MLETYKAKMRGNQIVWNGEMPQEAQNAEEVEVFITILTKEPGAKSKRPSGLAAGEFVVPDDFDAPLPEEILSGFDN